MTIDLRTALLAAADVMLGRRPGDDVIDWLRYGPHATCCDCDTLHLQGCMRRVDGSALLCEECARTREDEIDAANNEEDECCVGGCRRCIPDARW